MERGNHILLTGYEPFGEFTVNPSITACRRLDGKSFNEYRVVVEEIPMRYQEVKSIIEGHLEQYHPSAVICTGLSARPNIAVERVAINIGSADDRPNYGFEKLDQILNDSGPVAYWTKLPYRGLLHELRLAGVPAVLSNSAGTQGCNLIFYHLMDYLAKEKLDIPAGFVHVPLLPEQALAKELPSMHLDLITMGLEVIVQYISKQLCKNLNGTK